MQIELQFLLKEGYQVLYAVANDHVYIRATFNGDPYYCQHGYEAKVTLEQFRDAQQLSKAMAEFKDHIMQSRHIYKREEPQLPRVGQSLIFPLPNE